MIELTIYDYLNHLQSDNPDVRRNAAWNLGRFRDFTVIDPLIAALKDEDTSVRVRVVESLGNLRDERVVEPLIETLSDTDADVRARAASALGNQRDLRAVDTLLTHITDPTDSVRMAVVEALGLLPDVRSVVPLVNVMLNDFDENTRYSASRGLIQIGGAAVVDTLLESLTIAGVGGKLYIAEILGQLYDRRAIEPLRELLTDEDQAVQETARWALKQLKSVG
jgi:HEAT repeat protein